MPGYEVFRYIDEEGKSMPVTSKDKNEYLESVTGYRFTSETFRTWGATVMAVKKVEDAKKEIQENKKLKFKRALIRSVAKELGNTISVCERYYIHPKVLNKLIDENFYVNLYDVKTKISGLREEELIALSLLS